MSTTQIAVAHTTISDSHEAGAALGTDLLAKLDGETPDAIILFASPAYSYETLLAAVNGTCGPEILVGCSSAGEFSGCALGTASVSAMAIRSGSMLFGAGIGRNLRKDMGEAVTQLLPAFTAKQHPDYPFRAALVLTDALAGHADNLIHDITVRTGGTYQLFGGGAADDARFEQTHVFHGGEAIADAVVVLEMLSRKPIAIGVRHGWEATGRPLRVTESDGMRLISLNAIPAAEAFEQHAKEKGQVFNRADPLPFFLHNVIGIDSGDGYKIRVPLALNEDGSITCAAEIPVGATVHIMGTSSTSANEAARQAAQAAKDGLNGAALAGSIVFDCAATRLRLGSAFGHELETIRAALDSDIFVGCNTYGQIARSDGQFNGFHNCTAIVCAIAK